jgi:hypothetical protein
VKTFQEKEKMIKWLKSLILKQFTASVSYFERQMNWMSNVARQTNWIPNIKISRRQICTRRGTLLHNLVGIILFHITLLFHYKRNTFISRIWGIVVCATSILLKKFAY